MNWYKIAQKEKKPYKIYQVGAGNDREIVELKHIWAYSSEQARMMAFKKMPKLKDFVDYCIRSHADCDVQARLDKEELEKVRQHQAFIAEEKEKQIQNAWWNQ